jgi:hypothetical protein
MSLALLLNALVCLIGCDLMVSDLERFLRKSEGNAGSLPKI